MIKLWTSAIIRAVLRKQHGGVFFIARQMLLLCAVSWPHASVQFADERVVVKSSALVNAHEECWTKFPTSETGKEWRQVVLRQGTAGLDEDDREIGLTDR